MKVLIASGGSGGHIFPAVALGRELEKSGVEIIFTASRRNLDKNMLHDKSYKKFFLSANPMPYRMGLKTVPFVIKLILDSMQALYLLIRYRPDVVVGFGGYTAGAIVLLAWALRIKTVVHEQNIVPGRTNKWLDRFVDRVGISFEETGKYFRNKNTVFTGNPLREESLKVLKKDACGRFNSKKDKVTILVMGGSQGARSLNELVSKSLILLPGDKKKNTEIIHITGQSDEGLIEKRYTEHGIHGKVIGFVENINEAYSACDIAISRSGAAAIFELAAFKKPMVLIPYPRKENNQRFNAKFFEEKKAAIYKDEKKLKESELKDIIVELLDNPEKRKELSENVGKLSVRDGAKRLKDLVMS